ncbi:Hypothetical predicted protein [Lecanosticta acicola]|uniref:Uncharacterized protein n=1 Tax=Lecanosticta acicola TaxID=111012 RepID=A0AAI9ED33_9PEZI|nr:Hypothetical predicted protein [Lecanosticta acicola]
MSSNLMDTEKGGEQTQYEATHVDQVPHKKSGGQLGDSETTTDPGNTDGAAEARSARGQKTAENIRYGQAISEGGMSGFTTGQAGSATQGGYGRKADEAESGDAAQSRRAAGYGDEQGHGEDMNREVGA